MGSGVSKKKCRVFPEEFKVIYLVQKDGEVVSVMFSNNISTSDLKENIANAAGISRWNRVRLVSAGGVIVSISPTMPVNCQSEPYTIESEEIDAGDTRVFSEVLDRVGEEFSRVFQVKEFSSKFDRRLTHLERMAESESSRTGILETHQKELIELKEYLTSHKEELEVAKRTRRLSEVINKGKKNHLPTYPKYLLTEETIQHLKTPTFNIWQWEPNEMLVLLEHMYQELGLMDHFNIGQLTMRRWLLKVQDNYRNNPFHNFRHCFSVAQMMYGIVNLCHLQSKMSHLDILDLLTSAICHDLDHPGYNNSYQINARTELAIRYNDISPLENHHCAVAFRILSNQESNILQNLSKEDFKTCRQDMITLILATDMTKHSEILAQFDSCIVTGFDFSKEEHKTLLKMMLIKCCDISNEVRPTEVSEPWADCLLEEYFMQSDREKSEGLPVAPFMDREKVTKSASQIGFIKFVLVPLFEATSKVLPQLSAMIDSLKESQQYYEQLKLMEDMLKEGKSLDSTTKKISSLSSLK